MALGMSKKRKYAKGGKVNEKAKSEHRPMPEEHDKDAAMVSRNDAKKPLVNADWDQNPMIKRPKTQPLKHPSMAQSPVFKVKLRDQEDHLESKMPPASPKDQPNQDLNEMDAKKHGPSVPALHMKKMAKGGMINEEISMHEAEEDKVEHPTHLEEDDDQMKPSEDEIMSGHFARGGEVSPEDELEEERHNSIAAAIMAKRDRMHAMIDSGAMDEDDAVHGYADGGEVDLSINHDEQPNNEDQMSFEALKKENYNSSNLDKSQPRDSNLIGDDREEESENKHDMISKIRSKNNVKRQFSK